MAALASAARYLERYTELPEDGIIPGEILSAPYHALRVDFILGKIWVWRQSAEFTVDENADGPVDKNFDVIWDKFDEVEYNRLIEKSRRLLTITQFAPTSAKICVQLISENNEVSATYTLKQLDPVTVEKANVAALHIFLKD